MAVRRIEHSLDVERAAARDRVAIHARAGGIRRTVDPVRPRGEDDRRNAGERDRRREREMLRAAAVTSGLHADGRLAAGDDRDRPVGGRGAQASGDRAPGGRGVARERSERLKAASSMTCTDRFVL